MGVSVPYKPTWESTSTFASCGTASSPTCCVSSSVPALGSSARCPPCIALPSPPAPTRLAAWGTRPSRASASTVCASVVVAASALLARVRCTVSPVTPVSATYKYFEIHHGGPLPQGCPSRPPHELDLCSYPQAPRAPRYHLGRPCQPWSPQQGSRREEAQAVHACQLEASPDAPDEALPVSASSAKAQSPGNASFKSKGLDRYHSWYYRACEALDENKDSRFQKKKKKKKKAVLKKKKKKKKKKS